MSIWALIRSDYVRHYAYKGESPSRLRLLMLPRLLTNTSLHAGMLVRLLLGSPRWAAYLWRRILISSHSTDWSYYSKVGPGLQMPHPHGISIGTGTIIGENVKIFHHVTIGPSSDGLALPNRYLHIDDDVVVFSHTVVLGELHLGAGSRVGVHQLLLEDLPPGANYSGGRVRT